MAISTLLGCHGWKTRRSEKPSSSCSTFYTYKPTWSIVLLAVVDANYRFIYVDVGCQGRTSDGVFQNLSLVAALRNNDLQMSASKELLHTDIVSPFVFVTDDAFPLMANIMKPYARRGLTQKREFSVTGSVVLSEFQKMLLAL